MTVRRAHGRPLPDYLQTGLDLIFVGANPGIVSSQQRHYYANPRNAFWPLLRAAGFVPETFGYQDDAHVLEHSIGLTDLVKRPTPGIKDLTTGEQRSGADRLRSKLERVRPRVICFNGKDVYRAFSGRPCTLGVQRGVRIAGARVFVMPSTSPQNAGWSRSEKLDYFRKLRRLVARVTAS